MRFITACLILILLTTVSAERLNAIGPSNGQVAAALAGLVVVGAAVVFGTVYLVSHSRGVATGCVSEIDGRKSLTTGAPRPYSLVESGQTLALGERYKLKGRKSGTSAAPVFTVQRTIKDYGRCP